MAPIVEQVPRIDGASLVDPSLHSPAIMELLNTELSRSILGMSSWLVRHE